MYWLFPFVCYIVAVLATLRVVKFFYNARTRTIYEDNMIRWGCTKRKVRKLGSLWRWDLRMLHNEMVDIIRKRKSFYEVNRDEFQRFAGSYDERLDALIKIHRWEKRRKGESELHERLRWCMHVFKRWI